MAKVLQSNMRRQPLRGPPHYRFLGQLDLNQVLRLDNKPVAAIPTFPAVSAEILLASAGDALGLKSRRDGAGEFVLRRNSLWLWH